MGDEVAPAFYALRSGGWRDYLTLVHPPYTLWHLSYVAIGAAISPRMKWGLLGWTTLAFLLAMGVGAHALDELKGHPLRTRIPDGVLVVLACVSIAVAAAIGVVVAFRSTLWLLAFVVFGVAIVVAYNLELLGGRLHTPFWFAAAWGAFPALTAYFASAHRLRGEAVAAAAFALVTSLVQQRLSTDVRHARRRAGDPTLAKTAETALQLLAVAMPLLAAALLLARAWPPSTMGRMSLETGFDVAFAAGAVLAAAAVAASVTEHARRRLLVTATTVLVAAAVAGWVAYALRHSHPRELAVASGGLTVCSIAAATSLLVARMLALAAATETHIAGARAQLGEIVAREARERAAELERTLSRARADSVSALAEEERKIAEERRAAFFEREQELAANLTVSLSETQTQTAQRLADWRADLEREADASKQRVTELAVRQKQLFSEAEARLAADADRLAAESEGQRTAIARLRKDLDVALEEALTAARNDIEAHSAERRRALHELDERLRRREKEMMERIEREEIEATQRVRAEFEVIQLRQIEEMQRTVDRATSSYADEAAQQFAALVKSSREDAARRLARELDRAVETFSREAEAVLAEKLAHVGDAGAQRLERRLAEAAKSLERQRDEWMEALDSRIAELEVDVRRRLEELGADAEAERGVIEARLQELLRRATAASS